MNTVGDNVVRQSLAYLFLQTWFPEDIPYYVKILVQTAQPLSKTPIFNQYSLVARQP